MIYVFDSNALIDLFNNFYPNRFPSLWEKFDRSVEKELIISVREVQKEIEGYGDRLSDWAKRRQDFFQKPTPEELIFVTDIFRVRHFQSLIREKERLQGKAVADPFVIAKASAVGGCVVTQEADKPNAARIPNVCRHFGISCTDLEGFMERENWTF
jgi:hypothetical protein